MSGHSHWAGIKHKKAVIDAKRGKSWSKIARIIIVAARSGGGDPDSNLTLRYAIDKAKAANMPRDTIEKAVKKGTGELGAVNFEQILYEGYGPSGIAIMVEVLTDNRHRTAPEIKRIFERHGCLLGATGCVNWMFHKKGLITVAADKIDEDSLMEIALGAGADDMQSSGDKSGYEITCQPAVFEKLRAALKEKNIPTEVAEVSMMPQSTITVSDKETARKIISLMDDFEDHEDVQNTYANFDIPNEFVATIS
jgi:YebC/PmpR family DNA-binding regulatory protein